MGIKSREDKIILNKATGKFEKTSIITSEMTAEELRNYHENLTERVKMLKRELIACQAEVDDIVHLLGGQIKNENPA